MTCSTPWTTSLRTAASYRAGKCHSHMIAAWAPAATILALHGNGPLPLELQAALWREIPEVAVVAVRSGDLLAPEVAVWRGEEALGVASQAVDVARGAVPGVPVVAVGLGAGAVLAGRLAVRRAGAVSGAVAVAPVYPAQGPYPDAVARTPRDRPAVLILTGEGEEHSAIDRYAAWARDRGVEVGTEALPGLGHAFPARFGEAMRPVLRRVVTDRPSGPSHPTPEPEEQG
jgi:predicted esterase